MKVRTKEMERYVEAVLKALDILDCFQIQPNLSLKKIKDQTGLVRSRIIRLAGTLEARGYLLYDAESRHFQLGPRLFTLGKIFEANNTLIALARPILRELVQRTGELASLYVIDGLERVALVREKGTHEISYSVVEGQRMELYAGAAGKVLLAFASPELQANVLNKKVLKRLTPNTIVYPSQLARELEVIRQQGYAISEGERVPDVWSVAAPVFDLNQQICGSMGITGPSYRLPKQVQTKFLKIVLEKARDLSHRLGWQDSKQRKEKDK